jgi:hypothetical protein
VTGKVNRCSVRRPEAALHLSGGVAQENWQENAELLAAGAPDGTHRVRRLCGLAGAEGLMVTQDSP